MSRLQRRIAVCFAVVLACASGRGVLWYRSLAGHVQALTRFERTHGALSGFQTIVCALMDAEAAQRGFLITGDEQALEPYDAARTRLERERRALSAELSDSPSARATSDQLRPLIDAYLASMDEAIAVRRREGFAAAERLVRADEGASLLARLRSSTRALEARERLVLEGQLRRLSSQARWAAGFAIVGTALSIVIITALYRLIAGETVRRERDLSTENAALDQLARLDALTGLPNRRHLDRALAESFAASVEHGSPLSLVVLDVDGFKAFNDTFGHPAGDETLRRLGAILRDTVREPDLVARYGGEEFAVLLRGVDLDAAVALAERLRAAIAEADWPLRPISASFGVATRDATTPDVARLVTQADQALYGSKSRGRNRVTPHRQHIGAGVDTTDAVSR